MDYTVFTEEKTPNPTAGLCLHQNITILRKRVNKECPQLHMEKR